GKELLVGTDETSYKVTGVIEDAPANSHIKFNMLGSISSNDAWNSNRWIGGTQYTYAVLNEETKVDALEIEMKELFYKFMAPEIEYYTGMSIEEWEVGNIIGYELTPIKDIHLKSSFTAGELEPPGNISYIYIYSLIGVLILLMAIFNFVNLATAYSSTRAKEVGIRKVIGSSKGHLISQFVLESIFIAFFATIVAALIVAVTTPYFIDLIGKNLAFKLTDHLVYASILIGLALIVGLLAGFYPALILSSFRPVEVLKGKMRSGMKSGWLRNMLVTAQFGVAIVIIIGTTITYEQVKFMLSKSLGFEKEQVLVIERPDWLGDNIDTFKEALLSQSAVLGVSNSLTLPGKRFEMRSYRKKDEQEVFLFLNNQVNYDYLDVIGLELVSGRFFEKKFGADSNAIVINESAAKSFGFEDPIGKPMKSAFKKGRPLTVIGVVKDYNTESLHKSIGPMSLELDERSAGYISLKIASNQNIRETISFIEDAWYEYADSKPFEYFFFDEDYENLYKTETNTGRVLVVFASLSILIACLGLIGLITFTTSVRTKEIGLRKILGAGSGTLIRLLSRETLILIGFAIFIGWPLAYFASEYWLQNFADRIEVSLWIYLVPTFALILVVGLTISFQTIKAATSNPVDSLRQE
ncbi:MAG: FtsX-like permease family protein, partial [Ekhidna sp.]